MNRKIQCRAWSKKFKAMIYPETPGFSIDVHAKTVWQDTRDDEDPRLMQVTPFKDKHGQDIWEGDIVQRKRLSWQRNSQNNVNK